ncbi:unnamed protein product [Moneuplotes crassus]|uniref:Uncharacterized protein n=1 Tax=Euplotes crassus TaxID=5936 RepID=A0AAD1Y481_EUPCR|nr:unnamed protein product [Moneuplotes crassus]
MNTVRGNVGQVDCRSAVLSTFEKERNRVSETPHPIYLRTRRCRKKKSTQLVKKQKIKFDISKVDESIIEEHFKKISQQPKEEKTEFGKIEAMFKNHELLPSKQIQEKLQRLLYPYNKNSNIQRSMSFDYLDFTRQPENGENSRNYYNHQNPRQISKTVNQVSCPASKSQSVSWKKISDFICNEKRDFRKSLRSLNKARYKEYEEAFQTMMSLKPEWNVYKSQIWRMVQAIDRNKVSNSRRNGIFNKDNKKADIKTQDSYLGRSSSSLMSIPESSHEEGERKEIDEEFTLDDRIITKVVLVLKEISDRKRSESSHSDSTNSDRYSEDYEANYNYFTWFLKNNLKKSRRKYTPKHNISRSTGSHPRPPTTHPTTPLTHLFPSPKPPTSKPQSCTNLLPLQSSFPPQIPPKPLTSHKTLHKFNLSHHKNSPKDQRISIKTSNKYLTTTTRDNSTCGKEPVRRKGGKKEVMEKWGMGSRRSLQDYVNRVRSKNFGMINTCDPAFKDHLSSARCLSGSHKSSETASSLMSKPQLRTPKVLERQYRNHHLKSPRKRKNLALLSPQRRVQKKQRKCFDVGDLVYMKNLTTRNKE